MKNKKGFTLVEIIIVIGIIASIAGIFIVNISSTINKSKNKENENTVSIIENAAMSYVSANPDKVKALYEGYGYVDITVGELRDDGFVDEDLKNAVNGEKISDDRTIRISYSNGLLTYDVISEDIIDDIVSQTKRYTLVADSIDVAYSPSVSSTTWCNENKLLGLYTGQSDYPKSIKTKLAFLDKDGKYANYNTIHSDNETKMELKVDSCNVNPSVPGTYYIVYSYSYNDKVENEVKTLKSEITRNVYVSANESDLVSFKVNSINNNEPILFNSNYLDVVISITEYYRNSSTAFSKTVRDLQSRYTISNLYTNVTTYSNGNYKTRTATLTYKSTNSDGTKPGTSSGNYKVTSDSLPDLICQGSSSCTVSSGSGNYIKYIKSNGTETMFRAYEKSGKYLKIMYNGNDVTSAYSYIGGCAPGCCNGGHQICYGIDCKIRSVLSSFYSSRIDSNTQVFKSFSEPNGSSVMISIMSPSDYNRLASTISYMGTGWWLYTAPSGTSKMSSGSYLRYSGGPNTADDYSIYVYNYYASGSSALKTTSATRYSGSSVSYTRRAVKPIMQMYNAKILGGNGTSSNPYIVKG